MSTRRSQLLSDAVYYAKTPALVLGGRGQIIDYNIALEALFGAEVSGSRAQPIERFLEIVTSRVEGSLLPTELARSIETSPSQPSESHGSGGTECIFHSANFGRVVLACTALECCDITTTQPAATLVLWDLSQVEHEDALQKRYRTLLDHQLTWDTYAWSYDRILPLMPYYQEVLSRHRTAMTAVEEWPVIDLGAGTGNLVAMLVEDSPRIVAVDSSRAMLQRLRSKVAEHIGRSLEVIEASAEHLPGLPGGTFGGASILLALYDMERPAAALDEAIRLLRPGGTLVITEPKRSFDIELILGKCREQLERIHRYAELSEDLDRINLANRVLDPASRTTHAALHAEVIHDLLKQRGFQQLTLTDSHFGQCATIRGKKP